MNREQLMKCLDELNNKLTQHGVYAEVAMYGGAVMCLALNARQSTHDIDAIFVPKYDVAMAAKEVANDIGLPQDWFNDGVKGFLSENNDILHFKTLSNLKLYVASPTYMFAMKVLSCRMDNINELNDIRFLIKYLGITSLSQAENIIYKYYPPKRVLPKTFYMLEELLEV